MSESAGRPTDMRLLNISQQLYDDLVRDATLWRTRLASHVERDVRGPQEGGYPFAPAGPDALAERLKAMIAEFGDDGYMTDCLTTILALKSDQKRLDWLIDNCPYWPLDGGNALPTVSRAAIDAAMSQQEGK